LILNPTEVAFGSERWANVTAVAVDRVSRRTIVEWGDAGPHVAFADVARQEVTVRVVMALERGDLGAPALGAMGTLAFMTAPSGADLSRRRVSMQAVVTGVSHQIETGKRAAATRTVELVAVASAGNVDPVAITDGGPTL